MITKMVRCSGLEFEADVDRAMPVWRIVQPPPPIRLQDLKDPPESYPVLTVDYERCHLYSFGDLRVVHDVVYFERGAISDHWSGRLLLVRRDQNGVVQWFRGELG